MKPRLVQFSRGFFSMQYFPSHRKQSAYTKKIQRIPAVWMVLLVIHVSLFCKSSCGACKIIYAI